MRYMIQAIRRGTLLFDDSFSVLGGMTPAMKPKTAA